MDPFGNDEITRLLRLKRYEQPPPAYFENFLHEFRRRQREELLRQPSWRIWFERAQEFAFRHNVRLLAAYPAGIAAAVVCVAIISITIHQQPDTPRFAIQSSRVPARSSNTEKAPSVLIPPFDTHSAVLLPNSRNIRMLRGLPTDLLRSDKIPLNLKWESLDDQSLIERYRYRGEER
jgi:hypothetical protein